MIAGIEDDHRTADLHRRARRHRPRPAKRDIAMVFQSYALYPHLTVRENLGFGLQAAQTRQGRDRAPRRRGRPHPRPRGDDGPQARRALRRPAPARRDGPRDRPRAAGLPDGRAAVESRRQAARLDARAALAAARAPRRDHRLRHSRPGRGDDPRPARRRPARRRSAAVRHARAALRPPREPVRRRASSAPRP